MGYSVFDDDGLLVCVCADKDNARKIARLLNGHFVDEKGDVFGVRAPEEGAHA